MNSQHEAQMADGEHKMESQITFCVQDGEGNATKIGDWIIDSGASSHMTWDKSCMSKYIELRKPEKITLGDDFIVQAVGIGTVQLKVCVNGESKEAVLKNVLYVPALGANLFSVRVLTQKDCNVNFSGNFCEIVNKGGVILAKGTLHGKLYKLDCETSGSHCANRADEKVNEIDLWHQRLGHISEQNLKKVSQKEMIGGMKLPKTQTQSFCESCAVGKATKRKFETSKIRTTRKLELVHSDVCGPITPNSLSGNRYFITFTDDYSRCTAVYFMKHKSEALEKFKEFEATAVGDCGETIGTFRTDNGTEYISQAFKEYLKSRQIRHQTSAPYTPEQNGVAERVNRTLLDKARVMIAHAGIQKTFWAEAISTAAYIKNRTPTTALADDKTPYELWSGRKPDGNMLKVFGCTAFYHIPNVQRKKMDNTGLKVRFVGYDIKAKAYRLLDEKTNKVYISRDVVFNETDFEGANEQDTKANNIVNHNQSDQPEESSEPSEQQCTRTRRPPIRYGIDEFADIAKAHYAYRATCTEEPTSVSDALMGSNANEWKEAMDSEYRSLMENEAWELVELPENKKAIGCKWVFKTKFNADGEIERYKSRLVAKGYSQTPSVDYEETFSPVVKFTSIRTIIALAVKKEMVVHQMDVVTAFLNGELEEDIYMEQPCGYVKAGQDDLVCKLKKSLYGLKQSPRCWNKRLGEYLESIGFQTNRADPCVFVRFKDKKLAIIAVYVDDLIISTSDIEEMESIKNILATQFKMKDLGQLHYCLGMSIIQNEGGKQIVIHQKQYILKMINKFGMNDAYTVHTPADVNVKLVKSDGVSKKVDAKEFQSIVGSILYVAVCTRPDIANAIGIVSKFSADPDESHMTAAKRILRYLKGTSNVGLVYRYLEDDNLKAYSDANWASDIDDRRSTSGCVVMLAGGAISWHSKKQPCVALSTAESEYIALSATTQEVVWLRRLLACLGVSTGRPTEVFEDNQGTIAISHNPVNHSRSKHIDIRYHYVRKAIENKEIALTYCPTKEMIADTLTKPLPKGQFLKLRDDIGLVTIKN